MSTVRDATPAAAAPSQPSGRAICASLGALAASGIAMTVFGGIATVIFIVVAVAVASCAVPVISRLNHTPAGEPPGK